MLFCICLAQSLCLLFIAFNYTALASERLHSSGRVLCYLEAQRNLLRVPPRWSAATPRSGRAQLPGTSTTTQNSRVLLAVHCDEKRYARCFEDRTTIAVALPHEPRRRFYVTKSWGRALACSSSQIASEVGRLVLVACKSFETIYRAPYAAPVVLLSLMRAKVGA